MAAMWKRAFLPVAILAVLAIVPLVTDLGSNVMNIMVTL